MASYRRARSLKLGQQAKKDGGMRVTLLWWVIPIALVVAAIQGCVPVVPEQFDQVISTEDKAFRLMSTSPVMAVSGNLTLRVTKVADR